MARHASLEFDRNGIPQFGGEPHLLEEYTARAWDLFYGRTGNNALQGATAIHLRSGCRGIVYEAIKGLKPEELIVSAPAEGAPMSTKGLEIFLAAVKGSLAKEAPIKEAEEFDKALYNDQIWRAIGESMAAYIIRRNQDFDRFNTSVEGRCTIPTKLQAHLLLKFSGLNRRQRTQIVSSCNNIVDKGAYKKALRMQYPDIHEHEKRAQQRLAGKGKGKQPRTTATPKPPPRQPTSSRARTDTPRRTSSRTGSTNGLKNIKSSRNRRRRRPRTATTLTPCSPRRWANAM